MAHDAFYHIQFSTDLPDDIFAGINNNIKSSYKLSYINYCENRPPLWTPEIANEQVRNRVRRVTRSIKLIHKTNHKEMGHFTIEGLGTLQNGKYESFGSGYTNHMTIGIDNSLQGKKLSTILIKGMIQGIQAEGITLFSIRNQKLFIDADASGGFWSKIGMVVNPYGSDYDGNENNIPENEKEGRGYDMKTTIDGIVRYLSGSSIIQPSFIRRSNRLAKKPKRGGSRKHKKINKRNRYTRK